MGTPLIRCLDCGYEYAAPPRGIKLACPRCGAAAWISAEIRPDPARTLDRPVQAQALEM